MKKIFYAILLFTTMLVGCDACDEQEWVERECETQKIKYVAEQKNAHVELAEKQYQEGVDKGTVLHISKEERRVKISESAFSLLNGEEPADLTAYGIYELCQEDATNTVTKQDIELITPLLYYDAPANQRIVVCAGRWTESEESAHRSVDDGTDCFGVKMIAKDYSASVSEVYAFITDSKMQNKVTTELRTYGEVGCGFAFELQDSVLENVWFGMCVYDAYFESFDCDMSAYYKHTY